MYTLSIFDRCPKLALNKMRKNNVIKDRLMDENVNYNVIQESVYEGALLLLQKYRQNNPKTSDVDTLNSFLNEMCSFAINMNAENNIKAILSKIQTEIKDNFFELIDFMIDTIIDDNKKNT